MPKAQTIALAVVLFVSALTSAQQATSPQQTTNAQQAAPSLKLHDLKGAPHALEDYRGKPVLLNFWA
ncbi:MAG TPA: thiol-disulfide oxidoreductase, partial [Candidatus Angelobacter sp.]